jgi:fluoride exporter
MSPYWFVAIGGAIGSASRYGLTVAIQARAGTTFPIATMLINVTGSILLGFLMRYSVESTALSVEMRTLLTTGFCGGYTTFSTFSYETARLMEEGDWTRAGSYILLSVAVSLLGTFAGFRLAQYVLAARRGLP